jgi:hypothetical protein
MRGDAASASSIILVISTVAVVLSVGFIGAAIYFRGRYWLLIVAALLTVLVLWCYLRTPVAYQLSEENLVVKFRLGSRTFGPVSSYQVIREPVSFATRLWGNGGLFAVTGIYRNKVYGVFRAYVTNLQHLVLIETADDKKIVISPANSEAWIGPTHEGDSGR